MNTQQSDMIIDSLTVGPIQTNVYVVGCARTSTGVIIDGGGNADGLLDLVDQHDLEVGKILQTHAHIDHVAAIARLESATGAPIYLHPDDQPLWQAAPEQGEMFDIPIEALPPTDHPLADGQVIDIGHLRAEVLHLPGHSPGSVGFHFARQSIIISGDVLFAGSIGRVDLPGSSRDDMGESLARIAALPDDTRVLSGHGPPTTIGDEQTHNPFLKA